MANSLESLLKSFNKSKLEELKKKAEKGELSDLLQSVDMAKAEQLISQLGLSEKAKNADLSKILETVKQHPELLSELKKKL